MPSMLSRYLAWVFWLLTPPAISIAAWLDQRRRRSR